MAKKKKETKLAPDLWVDRTVSVVEDEKGNKVDKATKTTSYSKDLAPVKSTVSASSSLRDAKSTTVKDNAKMDIAPIRSTVKTKSTVTNTADEESGERKWFNLNDFDTSNPVKSYLSMSLGTQAKAYSSFFKGIYKGIEGLVDVGAAGVARAADALGKDEFASKTRDFIKRDLTEESGIANKYENSTIYGIANNIINANSVSDVTNSILHPYQKSNSSTGSILGAKSEGLIQSSGQLALTTGGQLVGVPWWLTTGATTYGGELENAYNSGATANEASVSALISGGAEILTEKLSGGISFGGKTLDEGLTKLISNKVSNKVINTLAKFGMDVVGEGTEEVLSDVISNVGQKLTYEDEKTWKEILTSEEAMDGYLESFIGGAVLGGGMNAGKAARSIASGRDYSTGLTANEQKVVDSEVSRRTTDKLKEKAAADYVSKQIKDYESTLGTMTDAERKNMYAVIRDMSVDLTPDETMQMYGSLDAYKLSKKERAKIEAEVKEDLDKGKISIEDIENALAGDTVSQINELKALKEKATKEEASQIESQINELEASKNSKMAELIRDDGLLQNSYREAMLRKEKFEYTPKESDSEYKKSLAKDFAKLADTSDKFFNNSTESHEFFETLSKIAEDKQTNYGVINNEQLKTLGYDVDTKTINGLVRNTADGKQKVLINVDSPNALNRIVGHETTHLLEGTAEYSELQEMVKEYAQNKKGEVDYNDYTAKVQEITKLYEGVEGADIDAEVTADLVGDYLFTDTEFVNQLSIQKPNIFRKVFNEIKHLFKLATAGSKEARQLEKVKKAFEDAYRQNVKGAEAEGTKYSISEAQEGFKYVNVDESIYDDSDGETVAKVLSDIIQNRFNGLVEANGQSIVLNRDTSREWRYSKEAKYLKYNKNSIYRDKLKSIGNADELLTAANNWIGEEAKHKRNDNFVEFARGNVFYKVGNSGYSADVVVGIRSDGTAVLHDLVNIWKTKITEAPYTSQSTKYSADRTGTSVITDNVSQSDGDVKYSFKETDNQGRPVSKEQQNYFAESKVRDADGKLKTMYRGDSQEITTFDRNKSRHSNIYGRGFYFTDSQARASQYGTPAEYYLNIKNPVSTDDTQITKEQMRSFIETVAQNEDYSIENYGTYNVEEILNSVYGGKSDFAMLQDVSATAIGDLVEATELFNKVNGTNYDGFILPTESVVFDSNQIKNTSNKTPTSNKDVRFSLSLPVEQTKDLIAVHNLSAEKLLKSLKLGGLPMPSIAITRAESGHTNYGDISLVFDKSTIDPEANRKNKVYSGDAWTPTYPTVEYKANEAANKKITDLYYKFAREHGYEDARPLYNLAQDLEDQLNRHGGEVGLFERYKDDTGLMNLYLEESGKGKVEPIVKETRTEMPEGVIDQSKYLINALGEDIVNESKTAPNMTPMQHRRAYFEKYGDKIAEAYAEYIADDLGVPIEEGRDIVSGTKMFEYAQIIKDAYRYLNGNTTTVKTETDFSATDDAIRKAAGDGYSEWLSNLISGTEEKSGIRNDVDPFTRSGNRRSWEALHYENNLSNVVKAMRESGEKGIGGGWMSTNIFGSSAKSYGSIPEIKNAANGRLGLVSDEDYQAKKSEICSRYYDIISEIPNADDPLARDNASDMVSEAVAKYGTSKEGLSRYLKSESKGWATVTDQNIDDIISIVNEIQTMPTGYFEAKPQRAVGFDEVGTAIVPDNISQELRAALTDAGISFIEYKAGDEVSRKQALNSLEDYRFSLSGKYDKQIPIRGDVLSKDILSEEDIAPVKEVVDESIDTTDYAPVSDFESVDRQRSEEFSSLTDEDLPPETYQNTESFNSTKTLNEKALKSLAWRTGGFLGISPRDAEAKQTLRDIIQDYATSEYRPSVDALAKQLKDTFNPVEKTDLDEQVIDAKKDLRSTRLVVNDSIKSEFPEGFGKWKRHQFNKIGFQKEGTRGGIEVDSKYEELSYNYPSLFPHDIINPADRLLQMARVASIKDNFIPISDEEIWYTAADLASKIDSYTAVDPVKEAKAYSKIPIDDSLAPPVETAETAGPVKPEAKKVDAPIKDTSPSDAEIAQVLSEEPKTESQRNKRKLAVLAANVLDKGLVFENLSLKTKNRELMGKWDYMLTSESRAQNVIGNGHTVLNPETQTVERVGKSLNAIREEVANSGKTQDFYNYMYHKHNVDRMNLADRYAGAENKPVFGDSVDSVQSQSIVNQYESSNPEFATWAQDVYDYLDADRQHLVETGVISQETADLWQEMYPHYVPIRRVDSKGSSINVPLDTRKTGVNAPVKRATGGSSDILPLFDTIAQRTLQTYRASAKNSFGVELMDTLNTITDTKTVTVDDVINGIDSQERLLQNNDGSPTFTVFKDGERYTYSITMDMYDALTPVSDSSILSKTFAVPNKISALHRGVLTEYNPVFALTNFTKDIQDVVVNSQHPIKTYAKFGESMAQIAKKGYWYKEYLANGGEQNSYYDSQENTFKTEKGFTDKVLDLPPLKQIAQVNDIIETIPRLSEYIASREAGRSVEVSMLDAARVTTNFKAGGNLTKFLNRNGATFLNASVQGAMQNVRNVREAKANGVRGWVGLAAKFAAAGAPVFLLNGLLWDDDDDYEELSDYVKTNYYVVAKDDDGNFIRIPKGRTLAVIQYGLEQMQNLITGDDEADFAGFIDVVIDNLAPNNPLTNNVISPIIQAVQNKTWYGSDLVPSSLQDLPAEEQYDESTDSFSKWLGKTFGVSPYKVNYLIDQYSGGVGDVLLPMMTPESTNDADSIAGQLIAPLKSKFTTSSVMNNQNVSDFWEKAEELTTNAKKSTHTDEDVLSNKYFTSVKSEISDLNAKKKEIQNSNLSKSEKYTRVKEVQKQINELAKNALNEQENVNISGNYATVGNRQYKISNDGEWAKISDDQITRQEQISDMVGVSASDYWNADDDIREVYTWAAKNPEKYTVSKAVSDDVLTYKSYTTDIYNIKADKNSNGKSISGSRKKKVLSYINGLDVDYGAKLILYKSEYPSDTSVNSDIVEYLNNRSDIDYDQTVTILTQLGMKVDSEGNVKW